MLLTGGLYKKRMIFNSEFYLKVFWKKYKLNTLNNLKQDLNTYRYKYSNNNTWNLRNQNSLKTVSHRSSFFKTHLAYCSKKLYIKLPQILENENNFNRYKKKIKNLLLTKYIT